MNTGYHLEGHESGQGTRAGTKCPEWAGRGVGDDEAGKCCEQGFARLRMPAGRLWAPLLRQSESGVCSRGKDERINA